MGSSIINRFTVLEEMRKIVLLSPIHVISFFPTHPSFGARSHFNQVCADMMDAEPTCVAYKPGGKAYFARFDTAAKYLAMVKEGQALPTRVSGRR